MDDLTVGPPNRVVINKYGEGTSLSRAEEKGITSDVIFRRKDGWTLGAPKKFEGVAFGLWRGEWSHFAYRGESKFQPIQNY